MGGGIAQLAAVHGVQVRMKDVKVEAVALALRHAGELLASSVEKGRVTRREADAALALVSGGTDYAGFAPSDLVVEAVVERMDVKRTVFQELEREVREDCVLATNTSSLSVAEMATALRSPGRLVGMHFFQRRCTACPSSRSSERRRATTGPSRRSSPSSVRMGKGARDRPGRSPVSSLTGCSGRT